MSVSENMVWSGVRVYRIGMVSASARIASMVAGSEVLMSDGIGEVSISGGVGYADSSISPE